VAAMPASACTAAISGEEALVPPTESHGPPSLRSA